MRLEIDWTRCDGNGLCALLLAEHIALDPTGFPQLLDAGIGPETRRHARRAVAACPALALRLEHSNR